MGPRDLVSIDALDVDEDLNSMRLYTTGANSDTKVRGERLSRPPSNGQHMFYSLGGEEEITLRKCWLEVYPALANKAILDC